MGNVGRDNRFSLALASLLGKNIQGERPMASEEQGQQYDLEAYSGGPSILARYDISDSYGSSHIEHVL